MNIVWTNEEKQLILDNAKTMKDKELARKIEVLREKPISVQAVRKMRQKLGIYKERGRGKCQIASIKPRGNSSNVVIIDEVSE